MIAFCLGKFKIYLKKRAVDSLSLLVSFVAVAVQGVKRSIPQGPPGHV